MVMAHRELLFRAISNLIDNALKYAAGGSKIELVLNDSTSPQITLAVRDNGPGIPESGRDEAVRRFGRLDPARTRSGAGLGLSLVATIVNLHGGTLTLDRCKPSGLAVIVQMPIGVVH
jgi:signal transduction histidine kinase